MILLIDRFMKNYGLWCLIAMQAFGLFTFLSWGLDYAAFTPLNLLFTALVLYFSQQRRQESAYWLYFGLVYLIGFGIEWIGVHTGLPFGSYHYGPHLAPLLDGIPLVIGINWVLLTSATSFLAARWLSDQRAQVIVGALLMVVLDLFIEPVAPVLDYWYWGAGAAPWMNYLAWFAVALVTQLLRVKLLPSDHNPTAARYYYIVLIFFIVLNLSL